MLENFEITDSELAELETKVCLDSPKDHHIYNQYCLKCAIYIASDFTDCPKCGSDIVEAFPGAGSYREPC